MKKFKLIIIGVIATITFSANGQETRFIALSLYNFTKFIDWPAEYKKGEFVIGVVGSPQVFNELVQLAQGKPVGSQLISVKNFRSVEEITSSHILFFAEGQSRRVENAVARLGNSPTLLVTYLEGATHWGAAINFVIRNETMQFELKQSNAIKYGLRVHSRLANLAIVID